MSIIVKNLPLCTGNIPHFKYLHTYVANFITMTIFVLKLLGKSKARYLGSVKEGLGQKQKGPKFTSGCGCVSSKHFLFSLLLNIVLLYVIYSRIKTLYQCSFLSDVNQRLVNLCTALQCTAASEREDGWHLWKRKARTEFGF